MVELNLNQVKCSASVCVARKLIITQDIPKHVTRFSVQDRAQPVKCSEFGEWNGYSPEQGRAAADCKGFLEEAALRLGPELGQPLAATPRSRRAPWAMCCWERKETPACLDLWPHQ